MNMGKTRDLWFGGELGAGQAETVIHTVLLSMCTAFFFSFSFFFEDMQGSFIAENRWCWRN